LSLCGEASPNEKKEGAQQDKDYAKVFLSADCAHLESKGSGRRYAVTEEPGDPQKLRQLAAGSFYGSADAALLIVSAAPGELERGLEAEGRTRELAVLARALGAARVVVAVTKMDAAANAFGQARFDEAKEAIVGVLRAVGFMEEADVVPVSGTGGDNLVAASSQMPWYSGRPLLEALDALPAAERPLAAPLRVSVREVYHLDGVGAVAVGCVEQGTLRLGSQVQFAPGGAKGKVKTVDVDGNTVREAFPQDAVSFVVDAVGVEALRRGMVASEAEQRPAVEAETFLAHVAVLRGPGEVRAGFSPVLVVHSAQMPCCFEELVSRLDRRNGETLEERPTALRAGDVGLVRVRPEQPLCVEAHADCPRLGQFATPPEQSALALVGVVIEVQPRKLPAAAAA